MKSASEMEVGGMGFLRRAPGLVGTCGKCGHETRNNWCGKCGYSHFPETRLQELRLFLESSPTNDIVVRTYEGSGASSMFEAEARVFEEFGYEPVAQSASSVSGGPSTAGLLALGLLAFGNRTSATTMTVTFRRRPAAPTAPSPGALRQRLDRLDEAKETGLLTEAEYLAKRAKIIDESL